MIEEQAIVVSVGSDHILVESIVKSTCSGCQQLESCGSGQVSKAFAQKKVCHKIYTDQQVKLGDTVVIGLSEKLLLSSAWQVYFWPLIGLISMGFLGQWLLEQQLLAHELFAVVLSVLGGYLGFYFARRQQGKLAHHSEWAPSLIKILSVNNYRSS